MARIGKRMKGALARVDHEQRYNLEEAVGLAAQLATAKFDETIELAVRLGVDPRQADQNVRGTVALPHGTGRSVRVAVFAKGEKEREAKEAGADVVGGGDAGQRGVGVLLGELAPLDLLGQRLGESGDHGVGRLLLAGPQHHLVAGLGRHLGDAGPHDPRTQNAHALDRHGRSSYRSGLPGAQPSAG